MSEPIIFTSELARALGVRPRTISDRFYSGDFDREKCSIRAGKLAIPLDYARFVIVPTLRRAVGSSRVDLQACKLEYSIVSPK